MTRIVIIAGLAVALAGCQTASNQQTAQQSLDVICENLATGDLIAQAALTQAKANATAFRVERDAVAAVAGICASRPVADAGSALKAASAAFQKVVAAEAAGR